MNNRPYKPIDPVLRAEKVEQFAASVRRNLESTIAESLFGTQDTDELLVMIAPCFLGGQVAKQLAIQSAHGPSAMLAAAMGDPTLVDRQAGMECGLLMGLLLNKRPDLAGHVLEAYSMNNPSSVEAMHVMTDALIKVYDEHRDNEHGINDNVTWPAL